MPGYWPGHVRFFVFTILGTLEFEFFLEFADVYVAMYNIFL